jgi:low affinity Fe/Cu permease
MFDRLTARASELTGHPRTFIAFLVIVLVWLAAGRATDYSNAWQLVINTGTTIATTGLVLLLQHSQNQDTREIKAALAELVRALPEADDAEQPTVKD